MKQSSKKHELGTAALYCRLSRDDNMDSESNSIQNQRKILQKAAKDKGYTDTVFFVDDGITGTTMKRPGFQKMLTAIEAGYISAVFVKDLSRLGRNYIEVGKLTEEFFPLHDIRLVAVSDGVDSDEGEDDFTPFKNIMNEYYAKDISKKRRIVNKMKGNAGVPLSPPPYRHQGEDRAIEWRDIWERLFRNKMAVMGMLVVVFLLSLSLSSVLTFDYGVAIDNNYDAILRPISMEYPFGTDNYGRCVFTRIVFGARISLIVGMCVTVLPMVVGGILGAAAGFFGKRTDNIIMRLLDVQYAVPDMLLAIAIIAAFGANTVNLILALSIGMVAVYARTVRATVLGLANAEFVEAARSCGARDWNIIFRHIIPNSLAPIIVRSTMGIGTAVLSTSSLSYLGLGVEPHIPEWGNILKIGSQYLETNPYLAIFPGLAIILLVLAFNFFGDGLRDALDPKLK